ncbi:GLPGLI family protein [Nonlabens mediterrranea]|uniref:GLPGLI family protein n=2 Tax=Nonlabens mediterrranea TaxID=1419947 RepID=A0ABS0A3Y5_9FLAO|nr:GLPGLI family protein [Nonlabens mediterrranea]
MKTIQITLISFFILAFAKAYTAQAQQDFKAKATYIAYTKFDLPEDSTMNKKAESDPIVKAMMEQLKKGSKQEYTLEFTRTESSYDKVKELATPGKPVNGISISFSASSGVGSTIYKNIEENSYIKQGNIMGKDFVIEDELPTYEWKLLSETKKIGQYNCFKAVYVPVEDEVEEEVEEEDEEVNTSITAMVVESDPTITAWYTPDIPVSNGPGEYHGLPGLIVEVQQQETTILLKEIVLNPDEKLDLKKPRSGKKINQEDFDALQKKKSEEMMKNRGSGNGSFRVISIGG